MPRRNANTVSARRDWIRLPTPESDPAIGVRPTCCLKAGIFGEGRRSTAYRADLCLARHSCGLAFDQPRNARENTVTSE
jgi:hypothetical protein